jgi:hypothetical protein
MTKMSIDLLICSYHRHELLEVISMINFNIVHKCTSRSRKLIKYFGMHLFQPCKLHEVPFSS